MVRLYWRRSSMSRFPFILRRGCGFLPRLPFGTGQRVAPQLHLAVYLGKLLDAGIEHERVLDVTQKLRYLGHALALLHEGVGCGEAFIREPYDKGLFLNRGIDLFGENIAVGVLFADGGYLPPPLKVAYAVGFEGFDFKIEQRNVHVAEVGRELPHRDIEAELHGTFAVIHYSDEAGTVRLTLFRRVGVRDKSIATGYAFSAARTACRSTPFRGWLRCSISRPTASEHVGRTLHDVECSPASRQRLALSSPNTVSLFVKMSELMEFIYLAVFLFLPKYRPVNATTRPMRSRMGIITRSEHRIGSAVLRAPQQPRLEKQILGQGSAFAVVDKCAAVLRGIAYAGGVAKFLVPPAVSIIPGRSRLVVHLQTEL